MKKSKMNDCRICKMTLHQKGAHFCSTCAYQKGICMMCGKKVQSTLGAIIIIIIRYIVAADISFSDIYYIYI